MKDTIGKVTQKTKIAAGLFWADYAVLGAQVQELEAAGFKVKASTAILHNPRLFAVTAVAVAKRIPLRFVTRCVQSSLMAMRRLGDTRWGFRTGSFIAALAVIPDQC